VHADYLMRDEWLRSLVGYLPLEAGVVVVVAGRIRPTWGNAPVAAIPDEFVDAWPVGHLATADALVEYAAVDSGEVHPYFLGLCADVALAAQRRGGRLDPGSFTELGELAGQGTAAGRALVPAG
jgi:hypothetical protein